MNHEPLPAQGPVDVNVRGWQPIETAPSDTLVVVGWLDAEDEENPERHDFDYKEDGVWVKHEDLYQEFCCVAPPGSRGPKEIVLRRVRRWLLLALTSNVELSGHQRPARKDEK